MKIAFIGHDLKFINDVIEFYKNSPGISVRLDIWEGHTIHDEEYSLEIVDWADVLFCEWGLGNVIWYQDHKKSHQKLIVRMHRFEMNTNFPNQFDYNKIDRIIAISPYVYEEFHRVAGIPREKMQVIYNGVLTEKFDKKKSFKSKYNIGIIGIVPKLKRLDRAIDILEKLYSMNKKYRLFIIGKHPKEFGWVWNNNTERAFYDELFLRIENAPYKKNVHFESWGDVSAWLKNIGYVLSVSDYESFHMAPIEGMASGAYPIVLRREGVNVIFPREYIFESIDESIQFITNNDFSEKQKLKDFVEMNYSLKKMCDEIMGIILKNE
ncbi:glycosyltransferase family 4 protein [Bacillus sp. JJ664]